MTKQARASLCLLAALLTAAAASVAQQEPPPAATRAEKDEAIPPVKPPEGSVVINLPSADTPGPSVLQIFFTHRFSTAVQHADIHNLFTFDSTADVNIGLSYVPLRNLEVGVYRARALEDYEVFAKYAFLSGASPLHAAVRLGGDFRTERGFPDRSSFFAQTIASLMLFDRVRVSVLPTFTTRAAGQRFVLPVRDNAFNVPAALSIAVTRSVNLQGEIVPRCCQSTGTGWIVAIEKTLPKHRFSFTAGNLRQVTVDQYVASDFNGLAPSNIYLGFNIVRQWKL